MPVFYTITKKEMTYLPTSLFCIELAYNLGDRDVVERYLSEYPIETAVCIPRALRQIIGTENISPASPEISVPFFSNKELVKYLILLWQEDNINDKLSDAARNGLIYLVPYFLDQGANIHTYNDRALRYAAYNGYTAIVKFLLDQNADIHADNDYALTYASQGGHIETVKLLLDRNADIHAGDDWALQCAKCYINTDVVNLLLERNANPNVL